MDSSEIEEEEGDIVIAIYNTSIKVTNRCQWLRDKWNIRKNLDPKQETSMEEENEIWSQMMAETAFSSIKKPMENIYLCNQI